MAAETEHEMVVVRGVQWRKADLDKDTMKQLGITAKDMTPRDKWFKNHKNKAADTERDNELGGVNEKE